MSDSLATTHPARRLAGIAALLTCALVFDPTGVLPDVYSISELNLQIVWRAVVIPILAAIGLWLVLPNPLVLAICTAMLSIAHTSIGSDDLFSGYLYPLIALAAGGVGVHRLFFRSPPQ